MLAKQLTVNSSHHPSPTSLNLNEIKATVHNRTAPPVVQHGTMLLAGSSHALTAAAQYTAAALM
jgi:hypothetical protein